ncbi:MAG: DNA gyrase/topoisomerase IV subunit A [Saprospiraceae bacterium]|nr:DNA gyrase/topoisomerase IV subunit A [Saprospiraceae bacterium]
MAKNKSIPSIPVPKGTSGIKITSLNSMYEAYFLDYASYVILERAVPAIEDGLKPVQRRILHALYEIDDGRYNKVANVIGHTMQYHPHGDAAIRDALVNLGQMELLIDTQGNWGDSRTGASAAAPRYIEARLTKFALEVLFNPKTTSWLLSYDGRRKEPVTLPSKFPILLAQGVEGIAVGLSTKILPHNFNEIIDAAIKHLEGKRFKLYPDFQTAGSIDVSEYQDGERGGRVKIRAKIEALDKRNLIITEIPFGTTTTSLIESILKANEKGKIKIKKITDNTAAEIEIAIELQPGISPDVTIDALYAFTDCQLSISPNACVIIDKKPHFIGVGDILRNTVDFTKELLRKELEIKKAELNELWHFANLEKIFIEKRIYHEIEECESWEEVVETIHTELRKYVSTPSSPSAAKDKRLRLYREITDEDVTRLTEIRIKRISKYNTFKADEVIQDTEKSLEQVHFDLKHLVEYTIAWFDHLRKKYGQGKDRKTAITQFENIQAHTVVANNTKLYADEKEGFIGWGLKKDEAQFICECSDIDDVVAFRKDGKMVVARMGEKIFMGKDLKYINVWKKNEDRTVFNVIYVDGESGKSFAKRFQIGGVTRDKEYAIATDHKESKLLYISANPNGESEIVGVQLSQGCSARIKQFDFDFASMEIQGRGSKGITVTKYPVKRIELKEKGKSSLGAQVIWLDEVTGRLNTDERGKRIGEFDTGDLILSLWNDGSYQLNAVEMSLRYNVDELIWISKFDSQEVVEAVYYDGDKAWTMVKRFLIETTTTGTRFKFITEHKDSRLIYAQTGIDPVLEYNWKSKNQKYSKEVKLSEFIEVKGWKALGNRLSEFKLTGVKQKEDSSRSSKSGSGEIEFEIVSPAVQKKLF